MAIRSKAIIEMLSKNHRDCCEPPEELIKTSDVNEAREKIQKQSCHLYK